jgi:CBS domain-containing protein
MKAVELMSTDIVSLKEDDPIDEAFDLLIEKHLHGAPVVAADGRLIGVVSQLDLCFGRMTREREQIDEANSARGGPLRVADVMTSPAVTATEETDVMDLCRMMYKLRIHRVPIVDDAEIRGIVSSLDICEAIATGRLVTGTDYIRSD